MNNPPTMVLYNVTVSVSQEHANDWVKYMMEEHIPEVLATGHFRDFRLCHVQGEAEGGITFAVQYMARDAQSLETYQKEHAPALQSEHQAKWGSHAVAFPVDCGGPPHQEGGRQPTRMKVRAKKHLGQHFLRDLNVARSIAQAVTKHHGCSEVLEVGPGTGALTKPLLERGDLTLKAVELDEESVNYLTSQGVLSDDQIFGVDLLRWDPDEAYPDGAPFVVAGNFPYNISSQILFRVLEWRDRVPECVGMFQKEVAERVAEGPGSKTYGILSVLLQSYYDIDYLFTVHEQAFDLSLIHI